MHPVEEYLHTLAEIHGSGGATAETSYYSALEKLLNEVGVKLKPKVRAIAQLANTGAGSPDFGLFTANQFQRTRDSKPIEGALPERGVVEVKGWKDDSFVTAETKQVSKYWNHYSLVLVTNYHDFVLIGRDESGQPRRLETHRMAQSDAAFRTMLAHPRKAAKEHGDRLIEFIKRVLLYEAVLTNPEDLAWFLASYAREARSRVEAAALPALGGLRKALEDALGMKFEGEKGEHFFRATFVQTLFYGIFSSWVLWHRDHLEQKQADFDWQKAAWTLHVPMIASLFSQIATPQRLQPLGIAEVLDWAGAALNRVDRAAFFAKFEEEHAVQYFYEPFLQAYDPELRKDLGVWYTPPEIVQYQVERVDRVLREELSLADGLADENVVVLDPCCGTGAYLVETLKRIHKTLEEKGGSALSAQKLKKVAIKRVFGFEILPAPFVVAHLQLGLMLRKLGAPLDHNKDERAGVYLTNALTGWEPLKDPKNNLPLFPELMIERDAANKVKQETPILVILGNPPYNAFAGTSPEEEGGLVNAYKEGLTTPVKKGGWGIKKFNLDDLYVRFFRIAERRIAKSGKGIVCYISNFSYLGDPSFVVMRQHFLAEFDKLWFDCMNGDSRETGKLTPEGKPDPSVFSTDQSAVGIRVGTAIGLMVRKEKRTKNPVVHFQHFWGVTKRQDVLTSLEIENPDHNYETATPAPENRYSFRPAIVTDHYMSWPKANELAGCSAFNGPIERRNNSLVVLPDSREKLRLTLEAYLDPLRSDAEIRSIAPAFMKSSGEFDASSSRTKLKGNVFFQENRIKRYPFKPFDIRIAYLDPAIAPLFSRPAPQLLAHAEIKCNSYFITRDTADKSPEGPPFYLSPIVCDYDFIAGHARHFPLRLRYKPENSNGSRAQKEIFYPDAGEQKTTANLSETVRSYLEELGIADPDADTEMAGLIWMHALAIGYSPAYLEENADGIRQDWPRIPLPAKKEALLAAATLGRKVADLLDTEKPVEGVTSGSINPCLKPLGVIRKLGGGALNPDKGELEVTAGWGHAGKNGVCMPGRGRFGSRKAKDEAQIANFGVETLDLFLNDVAYWENVPRAVWDYTIGGYQVIKKWLSYREKSMLGRGLKIEEAEYVTEMVRRIAAILLLQSDLDNNYETVKTDTWDWPKE